MQPLEGRRKAKKSKVITHLKYHEEKLATADGAGSSSDPPRFVADFSRIQINDVRSEDCNTEENRMQRQQVRRFLMQLEWADNDEGDGFA